MCYLSEISLPVLNLCHTENQNSQITFPGELTELRKHLRENLEKEADDQASRNTVPDHKESEHLIFSVAVI